MEQFREQDLLRLCHWVTNAGAAYRLMNNCKNLSAGTNQHPLSCVKSRRQLSVKTTLEEENKYLLHVNTGCSYRSYHGCRSSGCFIRSVQHFHIKIMEWHRRLFFVKKICFHFTPSWLGKSIAARHSAATQITPIGSLELLQSLFSISSFSDRYMK